jgi:hypothetical protein
MAWQITDVHIRPAPLSPIKRLRRVGTPLVPTRNRSRVGTKGEPTLPRRFYMGRVSRVFTSRRGLLLCGPLRPLRLHFFSM